MSLGQQLKEARLRMNLTASEVASATRMKVQIVESIENDDFRVFAAPIYGKGFIRMYAEYVGLDPAPLIQEYAIGYTKSVPATTSALPKETQEVVAPPDPPASSEADEKGPGWLKKLKRSPGDSAPATDTASRERIGGEFDLFNDLAEESSLGEPDSLDSVEPEPDPQSADDATGVLIDVPPDPSHQAADHKVELKTRLLNAWEKVRLAFLPMSSKDVEEKGRLGQWVLMGVGVLIILLFLMSGLSRCVRSPFGADGGSASGSAQSERIELGIDMPEPFFD